MKERKPWLDGTSTRTGPERTLPLPRRAWVLPPGTSEWKIVQLRLLQPGGSNLELLGKRLTVDLGGWNRDDTAPTAWT